MAAAWYKKIGKLNGGPMKKLLLILPLVIIIGCASLAKRTQGTRIDKDKVMNIKPGTTTRQMVLEAFGQPTELSVEGSEEKLVYVFKEKATPAYFGGLVENEVQSKDSVTTLELILKDNIVYSYRFKSSEN